MEEFCTIVYLILGLIGWLANGITMGSILKRFEVHIHVFALICIDAVFSTLCAALSTISDVLVLAKVLIPDYNSCAMAFMASYLPCCFGALNTLLISSIRFTLAKKSAKNIQVPNRRVLSTAIAVLLLISAALSAFFFYNISNDLPFAFYIEACYSEDMRHVPRYNGVVLQFPNYFNVASLIVDTKMLAFIKKTVLPHGGSSDDVQRIPIRATLLSGLSGKFENFWGQRELNLRPTDLEAALSAT